MNKKILLLLGIILVFAGCRNDKSHLVGNYYLNTRDLYRVSVVNLNNKIAVPPYVVSYKKIKGDQYVVKQMIGTSYDCLDSKGKRTIQTVYSSHSNFWLISEGKPPYLVSSPDKEKFENMDFEAMFPYVVDDGREHRAIDRSDRCDEI